MIEAQLKALRSAAGWIELRDRGLIRVRGTDRARFLDGQLTNAVASLEAPAGRYAFLLTPQGRIVADVHVIVRREEIWLETAAVSVAAAMARLDRYLVADDVRLDDATQVWARFALEGPAARHILKIALGVSLDLGPDGVFESDVDPPYLVAAYGWSGGPGYQCFVPTETAAAFAAQVRAAGTSEGLVDLDRATLEVARVEAGIPSSPGELDEGVLPAETGLLERAVSFTKGCYTGQEVVARMASRGRVAHRLVGVRFEGTLPGSGAKLLSGERPVGDISSAVVSPAYGPIGLAYVRVAHAEPGTELRVAGGGLLARIVELPFLAATTTD